MTAHVTGWVIWPYILVLVLENTKLGRISQTWTDKCCPVPLTRNTENRKLYEAEVRANLGAEGRETREALPNPSRSRTCIMRSTKK